METTPNLNTINKEGFDFKYAQWLKLSQNQINKSSEEANKSTSYDTHPILLESEINEIKAIAKKLASKGYEFELNLENRGSNNKLLITKEYLSGPYGILVSNQYMKPLESYTYPNFQSVLEGVQKNRIGILAKYNHKNMLIYQSEGQYYLAIRCHFCDSFFNDKPFESENDHIEYENKEFSNPYQLNRSVVCSQCRNKQQNSKQYAYLHNIEEALTYRVNEKTLNLELSSGGSVSYVWSVGHIYLIKN